MPVVTIIVVGEYVYNEGYMEVKQQIAGKGEGLLPGSVGLLTPCPLRQGEGVKAVGTENLTFILTLY